MNASYKLTQQLADLIEIGELGEAATDADVDLLMELMPQVFRSLALAANFPKAQVKKLVTKFRDAGRRTPPTAQASSIVPGRPQTGADGNRTNRWLLPSGHRYYADKRDAQLVEIKYYLQALSMSSAPPIRIERSRTAFIWLLGHELGPDEYRDPITRRSISFPAFLAQPRVIQSGHYVPLARGGRHEPSNTFLMLARSNSMQGDLTFGEFLALIDDILRRQALENILPNPSDLPTEAFLEEISSAEH